MQVISFYCPKCKQTEEVINAGQYTKAVCSGCGTSMKRAIPSKTSFKSNITTKAL